MKVFCPACRKYYTLNQDQSGIVDEKGTIWKCELCGAASFVAIRAIPSKSEAYRMITQMGLDIRSVDLSQLNDARMTGLREVTRKEGS